MNEKFARKLFVISVLILIMSPIVAVSAIQRDNKTFDFTIDHSSNPYGAEPCF